jgi:hypothetical protein
MDQTATRREEGSKVLVKWKDTEGNAFTEKTDTRDISETGISFYLNTPLARHTPHSDDWFQLAFWPLAHHHG